MSLAKDGHFRLWADFKSGMYVVQGFPCEGRTVGVPGRVPKKKQSGEVGLWNQVSE